MTDYEKSVNAAFLLTGYGMGLINQLLVIAKQFGSSSLIVEELEKAKEYYEHVMSETIYKVKDR